MNEELRGTDDAPSTVVRDRTSVPVARAGLPTDQRDGGAATLSGFATSLERAIPILRVATGKVLSEQSAGGTDVWAVDFSPAGIASVAVTPPVASVGGATGPQPRTFAIRPLVNALVARKVDGLEELDPDTGHLTGDETRDFQGVDLEIWAQGALADFDLLLSAAYVPGAYVINAAALAKILAAKKALAAAVAQGLDYVLDGQAGSADKRTRAIEALRQRLLISLSRGYATAAVLQYDTTIASPWATGVARLPMIPTVSFQSSDPALTTASIANGKVPLAQGPRCEPPRQRARRGEARGAADDARREPLGDRVQRGPGDRRL